MTDKQLDQLCINTIRTLSMDAIQQANSGHPGTPMAMAPVAYCLWQRFLRFDPQDPIWPNRDRFVLSIGHASMLLYSLLHLTGVKAVSKDYETLGDPSVPLDAIKQFRQWGSRCPGHPEYRWTSGIETTTGPLGQGVANSIGMAIAGRWMGTHFNRSGFEDVIDFNVYALCGDGCMMEGVSHEAASLAGHLGLSNLCWIYDNNHITIEGNTALAFSEDVATRFIAYGWNVTRVGDANDLEMLERAFRTFEKTTDRPTLIIVDSHIAYGAPNKQDTSAAHGEPLGEEEIRLTKRNYGWPEDAKFYVPDGVYEHFRQGIGARGKTLRDAWFTRIKDYKAKYPELADQLYRMQHRQLPDGWDKELPAFPADVKGLATRVSSGQVLNAVAKRVPWLLGGSADLAPSVKTRLTFEGAGDLSAENPGGRNLHFGIREHAMAAILNGMALVKIRAYGSGFLIFSNYARGAIRLSALMELPVIHIFTHDSIAVGEDGPTHQPVEHLASLRAMPGLIVLRPADANEVVEAWRVIMNLHHEPVALILTRQDVPTLDRSKYAPASGVAQGAYILADGSDGQPDVILIGTGSEVSLCVAAYEHLKSNGIKARVVSMPSWELFEQQPQAYRDHVLPPAVTSRVAVEQASTFGWAHYVGTTGAIIGMTTFGASAPLKVLQKEFGFTKERVVEAAMQQMKKARIGMRIAIGSDHAGFELKESVRGFLRELQHDAMDVGTHSLEPVDYPDYAQAVGIAVQGGQAERGIVICGSGVGASVAANKVPGIRAGLCHDTYSAHQGVEHDDMNVLVLGGRVIGVEMARELVRAFLGARFSGGDRHLRRLTKVIAMENPLRALQQYGQSVWFDYIRRSLITSGELQRLIDDDGLRGVTSNPAIFEKAIAGSTDYKDILTAPDSRNLDAKALYERIAVRDIQEAADLLRPVYDRTKRRDGYVSLEVSPTLAHETQGTLEEARRLWKTVARPNVMIKVPATEEGIPAIRQLIGEGINVNVTLLFSQQAYERVAEAYLAGLEKFAESNGDLSHVASVASFFISRIDSAIDGLIAARLKTVTNAREQGILRSLTGKVAIANAKLTYQRYRELFSSQRWQALADRGAQTQRVLWASTGTKDPNYRDVVYIEELIGPDTVNTIPPATFEAFRDHGRPRASLCEDVDGAFDTMATLAEAGISMKDVTDKLLAQGVQLFADAFDKLLKAVGQQSKETGAGKINRQTYKLPEPLTAAVKASLDDWRAHAKVRKLWARDASLWTGADEGQWLGWLGITNDQLAHIERLKTISEAAKTAGLSHALLLGMGGSSLGPEVMKMTFGNIAGYPELHVLDSTDPAQVKAFENKVDLAKTLFIVSSKSGGTLEPNIFKQYFFERVKQVVGEKEVGNRFIAITDPGSKMQKVAESDGFRHIFFGLPSIGGRYSVLSDFGLVPAAIMGVDVPKLLDRTEEMVHACTPSVPVEENPGVVLGLILGAAHNQGRNKLTLVTSPGIGDLGAWLEQLVAESTGKLGKGIIPVDRESLAAPDAYGHDRLFVYVRLEAAPDRAQDAAVEALERAGHPVVRIGVEEIYDLGEEFFRWEIATAVAGSVIGIHPFDQPDVEASKGATRKLTSEYEQTGSLPPETPLFEEDGLKLFTDDRNATALAAAVGKSASLPAFLKAHLDRIKAGDYVALLAYIEMNAVHERSLQDMRHAVRDRKQVATCLGFGPRFLHSTGQAYKGGPDTGVFLQITCDDAADLPVPGQKYTFGVVKAAQARGDFEVLAERGRRALRVHLGKDVGAGLRTLEAAIKQALT